MSQRKSFIQMESLKMKTTGWRQINEESLTMLPTASRFEQLNKDQPWQLIAFPARSRLKMSASWAVLNACCHYKPTFRVSYILHRLGRAFRCALSARSVPFHTPQNTTLCYALPSLSLSIQQDMAHSNVPFQILHHRYTPAPTPLPSPQEKK